MSGVHCQLFKSNFVTNHINLRMCAILENHSTQICFPWYPYFLIPNVWSARKLWQQKNQFAFPMLLKVLYVARHFKVFIYDVPVWYMEATFSSWQTEIPVLFTEKMKNSVRLLKDYYCKIWCWKLFISEATWKKVISRKLISSLF